MKGVVSSIIRVLSLKWQKSRIRCYSMRWRPSIFSAFFIYICFHSIYKIKILLRNLIKNFSTKTTKWRLGELNFHNNNPDTCPLNSSTTFRHFTSNSEEAHGLSLFYLSKIPQYPLSFCSCDNKLSCDLATSRHTARQLNMALRALANVCRTNYNL